MAYLKDKNDKRTPRNLGFSAAVLENPAGYKTLIIISMVYMTTMLCNAVLINRYIGTDTLFVLGSSFTSPFFFVLDDIIAEIYGYKIAQNVILSGFAAKTLFIIVCQLVLAAPYPSFFKDQAAYAYILGPPLLRIELSGIAAYLIANLVNSYILTRWKILLKGRRFWLRSLGSSIFSAALYSLIVILMMKINSMPILSVFKVVVISFLIKVTYSVILAGPANLLVNYIKRVTGIDVYDFPKNFTPFKYSKKSQEQKS